MKFRTKLEIADFECRLRPADRMLLIGSCFTEYIGGRMRDSGMDVHVNPFGILYNPKSIARCLEMMTDESVIRREWFLQEGKQWYSWMNDSSVSGETLERCAECLKSICREERMRLDSLDVLFVTLGTNRYYEFCENGMVVGNCHKHPHQCFVEKEMTVEEVVNELSMVLEQLWNVRPQLNVVFTVSPYRYVKYGFHESQLGKATLLLAVDALQKRYLRCKYFPAYELMVDDLRDYRFYKEDMLHPSDVAVSYIWERFEECCFQENMKGFVRQFEEIHRALLHRPSLLELGDYVLFLKRTAEKAERLAEVYPHVKETIDYKTLHQKIKELDT